MQRPILNEEHLHPAIRTQVAQGHADTVQAVMEAVEKDGVVVVGMAMNPFCKKARKLLDGAGQLYRYLEYGGYTSSWRQRNALKMWTGWPTFPMVFVNGTLVGGARELQAVMESGEFRRLLHSAD